MIWTCTARTAGNRSKLPPQPGRVASRNQFVETFQDAEIKKQFVEMHIRKEDAFLGYGNIL